MNSGTMWGMDRRNHRRHPWPCGRIIGTYFSIKNTKGPLERSFMIRSAEEALMCLYRWASPVLATLFGPMILAWMNLFYRGCLETYSPARLAPDIKMPATVMPA